MVPGSQQVKKQAEAEGLDRVFREAGAEWREPGCSMCLAMNDDRLQPGQYAVSTSNRNFEGRQGPGGRTFLASPTTAAAAAVKGAIADAREMCMKPVRRDPLPHRRPPDRTTSTPTRSSPRASWSRPRATGSGRACSPTGASTPQGSPKPDFVLNRPEAQGASVLVAGRNFGCGSSREHAVWALQACGFEAVVSPAFADIFRANALKNGLLPVQLDEASHAALRAAPGAAVTIDVASCALAFGERRAEFPLEPFARYCLLNGQDELAFLLARETEIAAFEAATGPVPWRTA